MYSFFKSKIFLKHLLIAFGVISLLISLVLLGLKLYTRHNVFYEVPNLYGVELSEAKEIAQIENIHIKVTDSLFIKNSIPGTILEQYPKAGVKVKKHRNVSVTICSTKPESIPFPSLKNIAYRQTLNTLIGLGFNIGEIKYQDYIYKNLVLDLRYNNDTIQPGAMIEKGATIDIVVGRGNENNVLIPLILKKTVQEAQNTLHYSFLNVGIIYYDKSIRNDKEKKFGRIWKQIPEYNKNKYVEAGEKINLWVTLDSTRLSIADSTIIKDRNLSNSRK